MTRWSVISVQNSKENKEKIFQTIHEHYVVFARHVNEQKEHFHHQQLQQLRLILYMMELILHLKLHVQDLKTFVLTISRKRWNQ